MEDPKLVAASTIALAVTLFSIFSIRPIARRLGLVDKPDERKLHRGRIPLIGGLCFFLGTLVGLSYLGYLDRFVMSLVAGGVLIVLIGVVDDFAGLSVKSRLLAEAGIIGLVVVASGYYVDDLGATLGGHALRLGMLGVPFTIVAVIGLINAFNMLDGIDGLAASSAMVSIAAILFFDQTSWSVPSVVLLLQVLFAALVPYLFVNLGWPDGRKVFMGDAGSTLIGFLLAWSLIYLSHRGVERLSPVDVLWCVAIPIMDTLAVMYRRWRQGNSPFKPDRQHLHHLLLDAGWPPRTVLAAIIAASGLLATAGYVLRDAASLASAAAFAIALLAYMLWLPQTIALLSTPLRWRPARAGQTVSATAGDAGGGLALDQAWEARSGLDDGGRDNDAAVATSVRGVDEKSAPLKALCMLTPPTRTDGIAPIAQQLSQDDRFEPTVCVAPAAGQDAQQVLHEFDIRPSDKLGIAETGEDTAADGSASFSGMERVLSDVRPDMVLVRSDAAASFATTLVAYYRQIPVVCVDTECADGAVAGRPDEASRKVIRNLASLHVAPSESAGRELVDAGIPADRVLVADGDESDAGERIIEALVGLRIAVEANRPAQYAGSPPASAARGTP